MIQRGLSFSGSEYSTNMEGSEVFGGLSFHDMEEYEILRG